MSLRDYSKKVREELGSIGVLQQKPGSWNIKLLMLIKGNQITQVNECSGFFVREDARVWDHWNCHLDIHLSYLRGFPGGASGKEPEWQCRGLKTLVQSLDSEDPLEWEMAICSSILARKFPWTEESGELQSMGLQSQTKPSNWEAHLAIWSQYPFLSEALQGAHWRMAAGAEGLVKGQSACLHPEFLQGSLSMLVVVVAFVYRYGRLYFSSRARIYFLMSFPASRGHLLPPGHFLHLKSQQGTFGSLTFLPPSYEYPCGYNESNGTSRITSPSPNP